MQNNETPVMFGTGAPEPLNTHQEVLDRLCDVWQDIQNAVDNDEIDELDLDKVMQDITRVAKLVAKLGPYLNKMTDEQFASYLQAAERGEDFIGLGYAADGSPVQTQ